MKRHSHSQKKTKDSVFVPQIQSQLQSRAWPEPTESLNPDLESPDLQAETEPGEGFEFNLANIPISAPTPPPEEANLSPIQTKGLTIGAPGDKYEQEADTVARKVVSEINQPPQTQGQPEAETEEVIQPKLAPYPFLRRKSDIQREENIARELTPVVQQSGAASIQCKLTPEQIKHANRIRKARGLPLLSVEQAQTVNNLEQAVPDATVENEPTEQQNSIENEPSPQQSIESQLLNGMISLEELRVFLASTSKNAIESLEAKSDLIRNILKYPLGQSWQTAKHELAEGDEKAQALMQQIWKFRQWHHDQILKRTKQRVEAETGDKKGLENWPAAGSTTLTSDIDVNLKGTQTELAVKIFNEEFKKDGWDYEAGVVYDVNVYALDFMHAFGGVEVDGHQVTKKEGEREGQKQGGFKERILSEQDKEQQDEWSLVKVRLYISNPVQWEEYAEAAGLSKQKKESVEAKYQNYLREISQEMSNQAGIGLDAVSGADDMASGISGLNSTAENLIHQQQRDQRQQSLNSEVLAENLLIGSSNRVYERKLEELSKLRKEVKEAIARYDEMAKKPNNQGTSSSGMTALNGLIEVKLKALRKLVSECALFSNEAYVTDAAVYHAVVGLQGGNAIEQTKAESMQAVTENMGDALKEISRHNNSLGEAAFKSGKYIWRMADAAKNMGFSRIPGVNELYDAGYTIANDIKGQEGVDEKQASADKMSLIGIGTANQLVAKILIVGTAIRREYTQLTKAQQSSLSQPTPAGKKVRNTNNN